jgi:hypothetical protein
MDTDPVGVSEEPTDILEASSGMYFWELLTEQTNLKSVHVTLHSLETAAAEILHLTRVGTVMEYVICHRLNYTGAD